MCFDPFSGWLRAIKGKTEIQFGRFARGNHCAPGGHFLQADPAEGLTEEKAPVGDPTDTQAKSGSFVYCGLIWFSYSIWLAWLV